jgi:predicted component of type VI protein secretion system
VTGRAGASTVQLTDTLYVGRECAGVDPRHRLLVTDPSVSRVHLELHVTPGTARVSATDRSRNGTLLNGSEMQHGAPLYLLDGDVLSMGDTLLTLRVDAATPAGPAPSAPAARSGPATITMIGFPLALTALGRAAGPVPTELTARLANAAELFGAVADQVPDAVLLVRWLATGTLAEAERQCAHFIDFARLLADNAGVHIDWATQRS